MSYVACEGKCSPYVGEKENAKFFYRRAYNELYERNLYDREVCYRERSETLPEYFRKNDRVMLEESAHKYFQLCKEVSKMNEDEFVAGVLQEFDEDKKMFDKNRTREALEILSKIPTDLIKAYLSMGEK